jgi:mono/diheme cytochrome c family protein
MIVKGYMVEAGKDYQYFPESSRRCTLRPMCNVFSLAGAHQICVRHQIISICFAFLAVITFAGCSSDEALNPPLPVTPEAISRGAQLVDGLASCGFCHSLGGKSDAPLSGGRLLVDNLGEVLTPNISLAKSGIRGWKESDMIRLFREYTRPDGTEISKESHVGFEWLSDADISGITSYLRTLPSVEHEVPRREAPLLPDPAAIFSSTRTVKGYVPAIQPKYPAAYGQYLADHVARCAACHNTPSGILSSEQYWGGGKEITLDGETKVAPNITTSKVTGIGDWSERDVKTYLTTGRIKDGRQVDTNFCPIPFYRNASDTDLNALVAYIRSVPSLE